MFVQIVFLFWLTCYLASTLIIRTPDGRHYVDVRIMEMEENAAKSEAAKERARKQKLLYEKISDNYVLPNKTAITWAGRQFEKLLFLPNEWRVFLDDDAGVSDRHLLATTVFALGAVFFSLIGALMRLVSGWGPIAIFYVFVMPCYFAALWWSWTLHARVQQRTQAAAQKED
ncbi:hypothetical protein CMUS01_16316 [Colletotrichum musicola]|uniref:Uncharacterized protein n=1 Tax=Colletotrichum musicola TaxID=2175873 RepID=A0A8H6IP61_9PEZI|nr:hypothetical protein CMUS01_16316 [Colletotrichum musicola]